MEPTERARFLERVDDLARTYVARAEPIRFAVAHTRAQREAIWRLRAATIIERGWGLPDDFPDGMERDQFDDRAVLLAGWDGDVLATAARLVFPSPGLRSPTETHFGVTVEPPGQVANLDRMIVAPTYSDAQHRIMVSLAFACWLELRQHGYHLFSGAITPGVLRLYRRAGWNVKLIGPPRQYWGEDRTPCLFDPFDGLANLSPNDLAAETHRLPS